MQAQHELEMADATARAKDVQDQLFQERAGRTRMELELAALSEDVEVCAVRATP